MKKGFYRVLALTILFGILLTAITAKVVTAEVNVDINFGPPHVAVAEPAAVVLVPHSPVYFVPDQEDDIFFHDGYWWSSRGPRWYRARAYNGPWTIVEKRYVPAPVMRVPADYRVAYAREQHIPYKEWKKEMKRHEKEERKVQKQIEKAERKEWKEKEKQYKHDHE